MLIFASSVWQCLPAATPSTCPATPVPDPRERASALRQVNELRERHPYEYGASRLLELARETDSSPAMRYAAAYRAMELAAAGSHVNVALAALGHMEETYAADRQPLREHLLDQLLGNPESNAAAAALLAIRWTDELYRSDRLRDARAFVSTVERCKPLLTSGLQLTAGEYLADYAHAAGCTPAVYACLYRDDWSGLRALADSDDPLAELARRDISADDEAARLAAADGWWSAGETRGGTTGWRIARRAAAIYRQLLDTAGGVERELVASRLMEHERRRLQSQGYLPGLSRQVWREGSRERRSDVAADLAIARDQSELDLPRTGAHVLFRGQILVTRAGPHELIVTAGSSIRITLDGSVCLEDPVVYRKRSGEKITLDLSAGTHDIELEVWAISSQPRLVVQWIAPGSTDKRSIPQTCLFYDPLKL